MSRFTAWVRASRPPSQSYIAFPILLGQMAAFRLTGSLDWGAFVLAQLFGLFDQLYIVYANDWADVETDRRNTTYNIFSGGSRVIVEGLLSRRAVGVAAVVMAALAAGTGIALGLVQGSWIPLALMAAGLALLYAYSFPPFRMSYRGGGEVLQTAGVGGILPLVGFAAQTGSIAGFPWPLLAVTLPISLGCAIATSLPDEPSDRESAKRTASVVLGTTSAQVVALVLCSVSVAIWLFVPRAGTLAVRIAAALVPLVFLVLAGRLVGARPGSGRLTKLVTNFVASNVLFFLAASAVLAVG